MGHAHVLNELAVVVALAVLVALVGARFRLPTAAALLLTGVIAGPSALGLATSVETIDTLAEVGVVLLLFTIGLELSLERLRHMARLVLVGGSLQVFLTIAAFVGLGLALGLPFPLSTLIAFVLALSSTAIVLRALSERRETGTAHGRLIVGVLVFQDLCVVPMLLAIPFLGGSAGTAADVALVLGRAAVVVVATLALSRIIVPRLLLGVARTASRDVFVLAIVAVCLGTAYLTSLVGLSLALGAFIAGLVVASSDFGHRAMGDILPLRDVFLSVFFVSMGMLFDVETALTRPLEVLALGLAIISVKAVVATLAGLAMRFPVRVAVTAGIGLAQFGEFGFVLLRAGDAAGVTSFGEHAALLDAAILTMFLTPLLVRLAPRVGAGARLLRPLDRLLGVHGIDEAAEIEAHAFSEHVIVVGYGTSGRAICAVLTHLEIPHVVLELNVDTVREESARGARIYYGDASSPEALAHAGLPRARAVVLFIDDESAAVRAIEAARHGGPEAVIVARTRYALHRELLLSAGANDVIVEQLESGLEMMAAVLARFEVPRASIDEAVDRARAESMGAH